jgi:predicted CoA-binding protein
MGRYGWEDQETVQQVPQIRAKTRPKGGRVEKFKNTVKIKNIEIVWIQISIEIKDTKKYMHADNINWVIDTDQYRECEKCNLGYR